MQAMLLDIGGPEFLVLAIAAVILFGPEKLPELARKAAQVLRYVRTAAGSAQQQLSKELGPEFADLDIRDLNPKAFVQKHLLGDIDPIVADVKKDFTDATAGGVGAAGSISSAFSSATTISVSAPAAMTKSASSTKITTPFDPDAT